MTNMGNFFPAVLAAKHQIKANNFQNFKQTLKDETNKKKKNKNWTSQTLIEVTKYAFCQLL